MKRIPWLAAISHWFREGYCAEAPDRGFFPMFALLARRLTDQEVVTAAASLSGWAIAVPRNIIADVIASLTRQTPLESDIQRVSLLLAADGPGSGPAHQWTSAPAH